MSTTPFYDIRDYGGVPGTNITAAVNSAISAAAGAGGGVVFIPGGSHTISAKVTVPDNVTIMGVGAKGTIVNFSGNDICFDALETTMGHVWHPRHFIGLWIVATGQTKTNAVAIRIGNTYRNVVRDVLIEGFNGANGRGLVLENSHSMYTEGTLVEHCHMRFCTKCVEFKVNGGTDSFAETKFAGVSFAIANHQVGIAVGAGARVYGSKFDVKFNQENDVGVDSTAWELGSTSIVDQSELNMLTEGNNSGGVTLKLASGAVFTVHGWIQVDGINPPLPSIHDDARFSLGQEGSTWALGPHARYWVQEAALLAGDGDQPILHAPAEFTGLVHIKFVGPNRQHTMLLHVNMMQYEPNPGIAILADYAYQGNRVFGEPFVRRRSSDGRYPHLFVPINNRNGGNQLEAAYVSFSTPLAPVRMLASLGVGLGGVEYGRQLVRGGAFQALAVNDTTPSVRGASRFVTQNTAATKITAFDDGCRGQEIVVRINDAHTTIDFSGSSLKGNSGVDWSPGVDDHMTCVYTGTVWLCSVARS